MQPFEMLHYSTGPAGCGGHKIIVFTKPPACTIIKNHTVIAKHQAVACLSDRQGGKIVGIDAVQKNPCVRSLHGDLAKRGYIAYPHIFTDIPCFPDIGLTQCLARFQIGSWPPPQTYRNHHGALRRVPVMHRCQACWLCVVTNMVADKRAKRYRCEWRPKSGGAYVFYLLTGQLGEKRYGIDI